MADEAGSATARMSFLAGAAGFALAILGAAASRFMDPGLTVRVLGILIWVVGVLAVLGLVLGIMGGMKGAGRNGALLSAATLVLLGLFLTYSGFGASTSSTGAPAATAAGG